MPYCSATDCEVNQRISPGLENLRWTLLDLHYCDSAAFDITHHVLEHGTLAGAPGLEPGDEAVAEEAYVDALPAVPFSDPAWGTDEDLDGLDVPPSDPFVRRIAAGWNLPPIAGGAPLQTPDGSYEPTAADLAEYATWSAELDARRHTAEYLARFNDQRQDRTEVPA